MQQPNFNSLAFQMGLFQVQCSVDSELALKVTVNGPQTHKNHSLALKKMEMSDDRLHLEVSASTTEHRLPSLPTYHLRQQEGLRQGSIMENQITQLVQLYQNLHRQIQDFHRDNIRMTSLMEEKQNTVLLKPKSNRKLSMNECPEGKQRQMESKMQMLNAMLQQKLFEKEGSIVDLQKKLYERDELVRELADKLMVANAQKQELFNEYDKILQNTIYNQSQESYERKLMEKKSSQLEKKSSTRSESIIGEERQKEKEREIQSQSGETKETKSPGQAMTQLFEARRESPSKERQASGASQSTYRDS